MTATILVVEDDAGLREALCDTLTLSGFGARPAEDGRRALDVLEAEPVGMVVSDVQMAQLDGLALLKEIKARQRDLPVLLMTAFGTIQQAVDAMRLGAVDYLIKPFEAEVLVGKVSSHLGARARDDEQVIAVDTATHGLFELAARVAESDITVMLGGESGTGKEVVAGHIHTHSHRSQGPFVAVNCAAIPENMLEAVLFGYDKGAFTGAYKACPGKFEQAQGGTLLLDEIAEMSLGLQAKLLRVLQEREVERLGARELIALDVRVLAATNQALGKLVSAGRFREDLYFRLNVFPLNVPPLRERRGDILPLARHFAARAVRPGDKPVRDFSARAEARLLAYSWPGNVRELDNVVQRALVLATGEQITEDALQFEDELGMRAGACDTPAGDAPGMLENSLRAREHRLILKALETGGGSRKHAAAQLGISPRTLRYKLAQMREEGLEIPG